jgi:type II secretory pathway component PulJ
MRGAGRRRRNQRGITLVEVLVAGLLGVIAIGTINWFSRFQLFSLRNQAVQSDIQMVARSVSDVFARDVRRAGFNPLCNVDITALERAKADELTLKSDLNADGILGGTDETLTYRVNSASGGYRLERVANGRTDILLDEIDASRTRFRFYDQAGAEINSGLWGLGSAERAQVRRIRLELAVAADAVDPQRALPVRVRLANDVDIRNRHFVNAVSCP